MMYHADVNSNSIVSGWEYEDWTQSMMAMGIDLAVEIVILVVQFLPSGN